MAASLKQNKNMLAPSLDALHLQAGQAPEESAPEKVNILVVDDLQEKLLVYSTILEDLHQNVMFTGSGEEALKLVLNHDFAVILLDVNMPNMDGIETAALIRKRRKSAHTPIIFLTAFTDDVHLEQGYASGAVDYLMTPVMPEILKAKVRVFIELSQMRVQAAKQAEEQARRKAAEDQARRKDAFLGMLAHELRNPLGPIRNAISLLQNLPGTTEINRLRAIIDRQVAHMARLVDDLLDSTRLAHGKILLRRAPCNLLQMVTETVRDYDAIFSEKGLHLETDFPSEPVWVEGDKTRLIQMVGNILHNAHKFTDAGGTVSVSLSVDAATGLATLNIKDTGVGIEPHVLPYIFDVFYQSEQKLDRSHGGLGLGLSLVKMLTELHGGTISASSSGLQAGSTFTLQLPTIEAPAQAANVVPFTLHSARRVLLIEDNLDAAETTRLLLEQEGHDVRTSHTGVEGLAAARHFLPHIILCDIGLPGMDGYDVARALRKDPLFQSAFLVALTGYGREEDRRRAQEAGFNLHLTKPVNLNSLREVLSHPHPDNHAPPRPAPLHRRR